MPSEIPAQVGAAVVVTVFYLIYKGLSSKVKEVTSKTKHIEEPETFNEQLNVKDKNGFIKRIDYWIDNENFEEALNLCNIYNEYNENDPDIIKRIKYINKNKYR